MIHELRIYTCLPGQLPRLLNRFETLTLPIWKRLGIRHAGFWTTVLGPASNNLTYLVEWDSFAQREAMWATFQRDPEWMAGRAKSEEPGPIIANIASSILQKVAFPD
ncbi:MAG: NIPSNAP family protein [bacterium]